MSGLFAALWGYLAYVGLELTQGVAKRVGHANAGQWHLYVGFPTAMLLFGAAIALFSRKLPTTLYASFLAIEIVAVIPFLLVYGGGV